MLRGHCFNGRTVDGALGSICSSAEFTSSLWKSGAVWKSSQTSRRNERECQELKDLHRS